MSGRARHLRDGVLITNRKTDRRRSASRSLFDRLAELNDRATRRYPSGWKVRLGFILPKSIAPFVSGGDHGLNVHVLRGFVQVAHGSAEECFISAAEFFSAVARDRPAFSVLAVLSSIDHPNYRGARHLTVVNGATVMSSATIEPRVYGAKAA
jgi:hypothetical protein